MKKLVFALTLIASLKSFANTPAPLFVCINPQGSTQPYVLVSSIADQDQSVLVVQYGKSISDMESRAGEVTLSSVIPTETLNALLSQGFLATSLLSPDSEDKGYMVTKTGFLQIYQFSKEELEELSKNPSLAAFKFGGTFVYDNKLVSLICTNELTQ